jgi:hypothetical protein
MARVDDSLNWVLEKPEQEKLRVLAYLLSRPETMVPLKTILANLGMSKYLLMKTLSGLRLDMELLFPEQTVGFNIVDKEKIILVDHDVLIDFKTLQVAYLHQSVAWLFLGEVFSGTMTTYEDFSERHSVSTPVIRDAKAKIEPVLAAAGIGISIHNRLIGSERTIRIFFFGLMRQAYGNRNIPFDKAVKGLVEEAVERISGIFNWTLRETDKQSLRMQFAIWYFRMRAGFTLKADEGLTLFKPTEDWDDEGKTLLNGLMELMQKYVDEHDVVYEREARFAVASIYSAGIIAGVPDVNLTSESLKEFKAIDKMMQTEFKKQFDADLPQASFELVRRKLFTSNLRVLFFSPRPFRPAPDWDRADDLFPLQTDFVKGVLAKIAKKYHIDATVLQESLFEEYLTTFVAAVEPKLMLPEVVVTLDMGNLAGLEELLRRRLSAMPHVNLRVIKVLEDTTDLYISDVEIATFGATSGFIWYQYPTDYEFDRFEHQVLDIMKMRGRREIR